MNGKKVLITGANGSLVIIWFKNVSIEEFVTAVDIVQPNNQIEKYKNENYQFINVI